MLSYEQSVHLDGLIGNPAYLQATLATETMQNYAEFVREAQQDKERRADMSINYEVLPEFLREQAVMYVEDHVWPADLLEAVIQNDLAAAVCAAIELERIHRKVDGMEALSQAVTFFETEAPVECRGSPEIFHRWLDKACQS